MKPVRTPFTNGIYKLEGGTEENDLPVEKNIDEQDNPCMVSTWEVNEIEAGQIARGARVELVVWGTEHPPVTLRVVGQEGELLEEGAVDATTA